MDIIHHGALYQDMIYNWYAWKVGIETDLCMVCACSISLNQNIFLFEKLQILHTQNHGISGQYPLGYFGFV